MRVLISSCGSVENPFHERYASPNSRATIPIIIQNFYTKTKQIIIKEKELLLRESHTLIYNTLEDVYISYNSIYRIYSTIYVVTCAVIVSVYTSSHGSFVFLDTVLYNMV
jgi:hypothetical protein